MSDFRKVMMLVMLVLGNLWLSCIWVIICMVFLSLFIELLWKYGVVWLMLCSMGIW